MSLTFVANTPADTESLREFLLSVFGAAPEAAFVEPRLLHWKYFEERPDWPGCRSYALKQDETIVAHGCAHPVTFLTPAAEVTSARVIDWAAGPRVPGSGVLVFRKFGEFTQTLLAVGGSAQTQSILPRIGFRHVGDLDLYARVVRPWKQFRTGSPRGGWKVPLRLARNALWSLGRLPQPGGWSASQVNRFSPDWRPATARLLPTTFTPAKRTAETLNFMLRCPKGAFSGFLLRQGDRERGHFILSHNRGQTRISDLSIDSVMAEDWQAAFTVAARTAAADPATCEIKAVASVGLLRDALERNGFRRRWRDPVLLYDPEGRLAGSPPLSIQLLDGDECYSDDPGYPFLC